MMHQELEGEVIVETGYSKFLKKVRSLQEKAVSQNQQQLAGMALAYLRGEMSDASEEVKKMAKMGEKKLRDFAKTKHEGLPEKVKESKCDDSSGKEMNDEEDDPRSMKTKINLVKNKMRAMGLKMSYEPEGDVIDELTKYAEKTGKKYTTGRKSVKGGNPQIRARVEKEPWLKYGGSREEPKVPGEKPPVSGEPGSGRQSPEYMLKSRRAKEQRAREQRPGSRHD